MPPDAYIGEFYQTFKKKIISILHIFQKLKGIFAAFFIRPANQTIQGHYKGKKQNSRLITLMKID